MAVEDNVFQARQSTRSLEFRIVRDATNSVEIPRLTQTADPGIESATGDPLPSIETGEQCAERTIRPPGHAERLAIETGHRAVTDPGAQLPFRRFKYLECLLEACEPDLASGRGCRE
jgi:hypothetical protein